jgi:hypothetical protein
MKLHLLGSQKRFLQLLVRQSWLHPLLDEFVHLFRCPPDERSWIQQYIQFPFDRIKVSIPSDTFNEIVLESQVFDLVRGLVGEDLSKRKRTEHSENQRSCITSPLTADVGLL